MHGADVLRAAEACREFLGPAVETDWHVPVPRLGMTEAQMVAHAANGPLRYAVDVWGGTGDDAAFEVSVDAGAALVLSVSSLCLRCPC